MVFSTWGKGGTMFTNSMKYRLGVILFVLFWAFSTIVSPAQAEDETDSPNPAISFVQEAEELIFGPPLPLMLDFPIKVTNIGNNRAEIKIQVILLTDEKGNNLPVSSIQTSQCENPQEKIQADIKDQVVSRRICLNPKGLEWGTYTALLQATLGDLAQTTKSVKLVAGPKVPVSILNSKITILGIACPKIARTNMLRNILCPNYGVFNADIEDNTNKITIAGYSNKDSCKFKKLFKSASGTLVSADGAGRILVRLDEKAKFEACQYKTDRAICGETRLAFWGSTNAGTYEGTFYLDTADRSNDLTKTEITFKARDDWRLPILVILSGLLVSAYVTYQLGPRKEKIAKKKAEKAIKERRFYLQDGLREFREHVEKEKPTYFVKDPDILMEVEFLLCASNDETKDTLTLIEPNDLAKQMNLIVPLFVRFRYFYSVLYKLHEWENVHRSKRGAEELAKEIEKARQELWKADSEERLDSAQDMLIQAILIAHDIHRNNRNKLDPKAPPVFEITYPRIPKTIPTIPEAQPEKSGNQAILTQLGKLIQWSIVLLSGYYLVYMTNQTFGTLQDYVYAFLWGSATNAGIDFVTKFIGANTSIMSAISGVFK